jgi:hypothetical protein
MPEADASLDIQSFLANVLAPIPEGEEQADTPAFQKTIARDMNKAWQRGMDRIRPLQAAHRAAFLNPGSGDIFRLAAQIRDEVRRQYAIPSPTQKELQWKKREMWRLLKPDEVSGLIARDEKRFAPPPLSPVYVPLAGRPLPAPDAPRKPSKGGAA